MADVDDGPLLPPELSAPSAQNASTLPLALPPAQPLTGSSAAPPSQPSVASASAEGPLSTPGDLELAEVLAYKAKLRRLASRPAAERARLPPHIQALLLWVPTRWKSLFSDCFEDSSCLYLFVL